MYTETDPCPSCASKLELPPEYIDEIVAAKRLTGVNLAADSVYNCRLEKCADCESCSDGVMCMVCGCFVKFRALGESNYCPHPNGNRWA